jgi:sec-independent protein translocase protein TatA
MTPLLAFSPFNIGPMEMVIVGVIALLLFGKRLPEVARNMGKGITEFKKGMRGIDDEPPPGWSAEQQKQGQPARPAAAEDRVEPTAPKFEPPATPPVNAEKTA